MVQLAPAATLAQPAAGVAANWAALAPVTAVVTGMAAALVLLTVTTWGVAVVVAGSWLGKAAEVGLALRPGASLPMTMNWLSETVFTPTPPTFGPDTVTELTPMGLPTTACGVTPSPSRPAAGADTAGSQLRYGPTGPVSAEPKIPGTPGVVSVNFPLPRASVVKESAVPLHVPSFGAVQG